MTNKVKKRFENIEEVLEVQDEKITEITSIIKEMISNYHPYSGALILSVNEGESTNRYFMVSDFHVNDPFITFYHLISEDGRDLTLESFPAKSSGKSILQHMKSVYKTNRWTIVKEQIMLGSFVSISSIGGFDYAKPLKQGDYPYKFNENPDAVKPLKKEA